MSRTYRRKNIEFTLGSSWDRRGVRAVGYDVIYQRHWNGEIEIRERTKREKFEFWYWLHGESRSGCRSPSKWFRRMKSHKSRQYNKREIQKFMNDPSYEPMVVVREEAHTFWDWR